MVYQITLLLSSHSGLWWWILEVEYQGWGRTVSAQNRDITCGCFLLLFSTKTDFIGHHVTDIYNLHLFSSIIWNNDAIALKTFETMMACQQPADDNGFVREVLCKHGEYRPGHSRRCVYTSMVVGVSSFGWSAGGGDMVEWRNGRSVVSSGAYIGGWIVRFVGRGGGAGKQRDSFARQCKRSNRFNKQDSALSWYFQEKRANRIKRRTQWWSRLSFCSDDRLLVLLYVFKQNMCTGRSI